MGEKKTTNAQYAYSGYSKKQSLLKRNNFRSIVLKLPGAAIFLGSRTPNPAEDD
jgi:hypothetical protein